MKVPLSVSPIATPPVIFPILIESQHLINSLPAVYKGCQASANMFEVRRAPGDDLSRRHDTSLDAALVFHFSTVDYQVVTTVAIYNPRRW